MSIFQTQVTRTLKSVYGDGNMSYDNQLFFCPRVFAKDGFNVSLQIHNGNYCSSENGYRKMGHTMQEVEFGFPSENEILLHPYAECFSENDIDFDCMGGVGSIPISALETIFEKHGGIDWEKTISIEQYDKIVLDKRPN